LGYLIAGVIRKKRLDMIQFFTSFLKGHPLSSGIIAVGILAGTATLLTWFHPDRSHFEKQTPVKERSAENSADRSLDFWQSLRKTAKTTTGVESDLPAGEAVKRPPLPEEMENKVYSTDFDATEALETPVEETIALFEDRVLSHTSATRVRVETQFRPDAGAEVNRKLPGYVAFTITAGDNYPEGVAMTMEDIAAEYFLQFPDAPSVRVSIVVGGRVRGGRTFKQSPLH
jgi:hypothetical protein